MRSISASLASLSSSLRSSPTASATFSFSATKAFVHSALAAASALGTNASNRSASFRACSCLRTKDFAISFTMNTQSSATETWARRAAVSRCVARAPPLTAAHLCSIGREQLLQRALLAAGDRTEPNSLTIGALRGARLHVAVDALPQRLAPAQTEQGAQPAARPPPATCTDSWLMRTTPSRRPALRSRASQGSRAGPPRLPRRTLPSQPAGAEPKRRSLRPHPAPLEVLSQRSQSTVCRLFRTKTPRPARAPV